MTNKLQLLTVLTLATILLAGGLSLTPDAFSTGSNDKDNDKDKKDKKGGEDSNKYKDWKKEKEKHDDDDDDDKNKKVKICHIPPGNEGNAHTIEISESALASHLEHGDTLDACPDEDDDEEPTQIILIRTITDDNIGSHDVSSFIIKIDSMQIADADFGQPIAITPNTPHTIDGTIPSDYKFVLIAGDPACPVNLNADTFSLKEGQTIVCTIYYDDLFVPGGATGPDPIVTLHVEIIDPDLGVNPTFEIDGVPVTLDTPIDLIADQTSTITQTDDGVASDPDPDIEVLPSKITGDGHCPEVLEGTVTLSSGQKIDCTFVYGKEIEPGVIFHFASQMVAKDSITEMQDPNVGISCGEIVPFLDSNEDDTGFTRYENTATEGPCIAINAGDIWVVPQPSITLTDTTIVLFTVIITDSDVNTQVDPLKTTCVFNGLAPTLDQKDGFVTTVDPDAPLAFRLHCTDLPDVGNWNVNYALIETVV